MKPIKTTMDAERLLTGVKLTRSLIVWKISEFFDPCGFFESVKLQMKLQSSSMKGKEWDEVLSEQDQETWRQILKEYVNLPEITIPRFCIPSKRVSKSKMRLICLADAAEFAGGEAVYASKETSPCVWSLLFLSH